MSENTITFSVHVPTPSQYMFEVFATKGDSTCRIQEDNAIIAPLKLKCACQFKLVCREMESKMHPLPDCAPGEWGPKKAVRHFNMLPVLSPGPAGDGEKVGIIMAKEECQLRFRLPCPLVMAARLRMNQVEEKALEPFVSMSKDDRVVTIKVTLPQEGQYGLDIFARPKAAVETVSLSHACKFLINCSQVTNPVELPRLPEPPKKNKWGPTPAFDVYALELISHKEPKVYLNGGATSCVIDLHVPQGVQLSFQFLRQPDEDLRKNVQVSHEEEKSHRVRYEISVPGPGNYMLCLYARRADSEDRALANVYNYLIQNGAPAPTPSKEPSPPPASRKSSIFKKGLFSSKKDKSGKDKGSKDKDKSKDKSVDRLSDKSSEKSF